MAHDSQTALFTFDELLKGLAPAIVLDGEPDQSITGFSIDTRSLQPGNVFVALKDVRDGHEFVTNAFKAGASAALVDWKPAAWSGGQGTASASIAVKTSGPRSAPPERTIRAPSCDQRRVSSPRSLLPPFGTSHQDAVMRSSACAVPETTYA